MRKMALMAVFFCSFSAFTCDMDGFGLGGFMPPNEMSVPVGDKNANDMTEARFNEIIDKVVAVYQPIFRKQMRYLHVVRNWKSDTVNAAAQKMLRLHFVMMFGGLARHNDVTDDAFALVVCHEIGHHLAGAPRYPARWASNEGQSDYWGAMKCFRRAFMNDHNVEIMADRDIPEIVTNKCQSSFKTPEEIALCQRTAMAGKSLGTLLNRSKPVYFDRPDPNVVERTVHAHPAGQCRLDTYFQAALCTSAIDDGTSSRNPNKGVCSRQNGRTVGVRPLCWYKP